MMKSNNFFELYSKTNKYNYLLKNTIEQIKKITANHKNITVSWSTGKDSTVVLDLIIKHGIGNIYPVNINANAQWDDSKKLIEKWEKITKIYKIKSKEKYQSIRIREINGENLSDSYKMKQLVWEPFKDFNKKNNIDLQIIGLRAGESTRRKKLFKYRKNYEYVKYMNVYNFHPLYNWSSLDVWTYLISENIPHNQLYYKYQETFGGNIYDYRVDEYLEIDCLQKGGIEILQKYEPETFKKEYDILKNYFSYYGNF